MLFNSFEFFVFLSFVFLIFWILFTKSAVLGNLFLLLSSLFFYSWADIHFLILLIISILFNYLIGILIYDKNNDQIKQIFLWLGVILNVGLLGYFKYYNFFYTNFCQILNQITPGIEVKTLNIILPLGISFFTFQNLGYLVDIYNEKIKPTRNLIDFSLFVAFFPKLLSGPIERANNLMPQFKKKSLIIT